jgi:hypothetical protein
MRLADENSARIKPLNRHLLIVANAFRVVGFLVGIPSLLICLWLTALKLQLFWLKPDKSIQTRGEAINIGRDGIVGIIVAGATVIGKGFEIANSAAGWIAGILDIAAAILALAGACLFFTGRGLVLHSTWARIAAGFASAGFLLVSLTTMTALRRGTGFALIPIAAALYMLWVLIRRFN